MGRLAEVNRATLLQLKLYDGDTSRGVQARIYDSSGTEQTSFGSPFTLAHYARGNYKINTWIPTAQGDFTVNYEVYTDGTFATLDTDYIQLCELVFVRSTIQGLIDGTASAGTASTITLDSLAVATTDYYKNSIIQLVSGTGAGQSKIITGYTSGRVATVDSNWATNPDSTTKYSVLPFGGVPVTITDKTGFSLTSAEHIAIGVDVWDTSRSDHQVAGSFGLSNQTTRDGTAQAGASTTITLDASASATNDIYNGNLIYIYSGTGAGQTKVVKSYVGSTKIVTVDSTWVITPNSSSKFVIIQTKSPVLGSDGRVLVTADAHSAGSTVAGVTAGVIVSTNNDKTGYSLSQAFPTNFSSLAINGTGQITVGTNADKTNYTLTTGEHTLIGVDVWDTARSSHQVVGSFGLTLQHLRDGTATAGTTSTITLDGSASTVTDFYKGNIVLIYAGTGSGQSRMISTYSTGRVATVAQQWGTTPDNTSKFLVLYDRSPVVGSDDKVLVSADAHTSGETIAGGSVTVSDKTGFSLTTGEHTLIGNDVWDTLRSGHTVSNSFGSGVNVFANLTGSIMAASFVAGAIDANAIAADAIGSSELATSAVDEIAAAILSTPANKLATGVGGTVTVGTNNDKTGYSLTQTFPSNFALLAINGSGQVTVGTNADKTGYTLTGAEHTAIGVDVWDTSRSGHQVAGSFGISNQVSRDATSQTGSTSTTIKLDASASAITDIYKNSIVFIMAGTGSGQSKLVTTYDGSTKVATVDSAWVTTPDNTSRFTIIPFGSVAYQVLSVPTNVLLTNTSGHITPADTSITAAKFAANAIDANALATSAVTEIVTAIFGNVIDTKTFAEIQEIMLAYSTGKIIRSTDAYAYKKQDDTTTLFTLNSTSTERTRS